MALVGFELTTSTIPPSTTLSNTSPKCVEETTRKRIIRVALIYVSDNEVHVV